MATHRPHKPFTRVRIPLLPSLLYRCISVWLECFVWGEVVVGSNPTTYTFRDTMKICKGCKQNKSEEEFPWKKKNISRRTHCKECQKAVVRKYYIKNRIGYVKRSREQYILADIRYKEIVWGYKISHPCTNCGETHPAALDFHHLGNKEGTISAMKRSSPLTLKREMDKCVVLCSNCHRKLHYNEKNS